MKTYNKTYIRVLDHLLGVEKHLSVFFPNSLYYEMPEFLGFQTGDFEPIWSTLS
jgi:hypothetical protein